VTFARRCAGCFAAVALSPAAAGVAQAQAIDRNVYWALYPVSAIGPGGQVDPLRIRRGTGVVGVLTFAPDTAYVFLQFKLRPGLVVRANIAATQAGRNIDLEDPRLIVDATPDADNDTVGDLVEFIVGTLPNDDDTDDDGSPDGAELDLLTDPLDGIGLPTGIIAALQTPGEAVDLDARDQLLAVADGTRGVLIASIFNGLSPKVIGQVETPGFAGAVAIDGNRVAAADGASGLAILDIGDPNNAFLFRQVGLPGIVGAVASKGQYAYAGTTSGRIAVVDLRTGLAVDGRDLVPTSPVHDLTVGANVLYVLTAGGLHTIALNRGRLGGGTHQAVPGLFIGGIMRRLRLFWAEGTLLVTRQLGYMTYSLVNPLAPTPINVGPSGQFGWKHVVDSGSGLGFVATAANSDGPHDVSVYDTSNPAINNAVITSYPTPGNALSVAIYNGLGYVADGASGVQVVNYLALDNQRVPPTVALTTSAIAGQATEGQLFRVAASADDDFQVKAVEFFVNDQLAVVDGNFPFDHVFVAPTIAMSGTSFRLRARAIDTAGNEGSSQEMIIGLSPDADPPTVSAVVPANAQMLYEVPAVSVSWSETIATASVNASTFSVTGAGPDQMFGGGDDFAVAGTYGYREELATSVFLPATAFAPGLYRVGLSGVTDLKGNPLAGAVQSMFRLLDGNIDSDGDGVPDDIERYVTNTDPNDTDSDDDGTPDGLEDADSDALPNACEFAARTIAIQMDSDGDGVPDGAEDPDVDGLTNTQECALRTDPLRTDTDGDGAPDGFEFDSGSDPLLAASRPRPFTVASPPLLAYVPQLATGTSANTVAGMRPVLTYVPNIQPVVGQLNTIVDPLNPKIQVFLPQLDNSTRNTTLAIPPVVIQWQ
jgi:hypothetical protein